MSRGSKAPKITGRRSLVNVEQPRQPTGIELGADDPAVGRGCTRCGKAMKRGDRVSATGLRHLACPADDESAPPA